MDYSTETQDQAMSATASTQESSTRSPGQAKTSVFDLPAELRNSIYDLALYDLPTHHALHLGRTLNDTSGLNAPVSKPKYPVTLLLASKGILNEVHAMLWRWCKVHLHSLPQTTFQGPEKLECVRTISLDFNRGNRDIFEFARLLPKLTELALFVQNPRLVGLADIRFDTGFSGLEQISLRCLSLEAEEWREDGTDSQLHRGQRGWTHPSIQERGALSYRRVYRTRDRRLLETIEWELNLVLSRRNFRSPGAQAQ